METVLIVVLVLVVIVLALAAMRPNTFSVERSTTINAPPEKVFALINDMKAFNSWNPWLRMDPNTVGTYAGAQAGRGAAYAWESKKVGTGRMEITESTPSSRVTLDLHFLKPFEGHNVANFTLTPQAGATTVTWAMHGPQAFIPKLMGLFFSMDKMIGKSFEEGLANMKAIAEK